MQAGRPFQSCEVIPTAFGTNWMPLALAPSIQTSPFGKVFIGGIG